MNKEEIIQKRERIEKSIKDLDHKIYVKQGLLIKIKSHLLACIYKEKSGKKVFPKNVRVLRFSDHLENERYSNWKDSTWIEHGRGLKINPHGIGILEEEEDIDTEKINNNQELKKILNIEDKEWVIVLLKTSDETNTPYKTSAIVTLFSDFNPFRNDGKFMENPDIIF